jgi:hypothetical protein
MTIKCTVTVIGIAEALTGGILVRERALGTSGASDAGALPSLADAFDSRSLKLLRLCRRQCIRLDLRMILVMQWKRRAAVAGPLIKVKQLRCRYARSHAIEGAAIFNERPFN